MVERQREGISSLSMTSMPRPSLQEAFIQCLEYHPAKRFSRIFEEYYGYNPPHSEAVESIYLDQTLWDLEGLFNQLDLIEGRVGIQSAQLIFNKILAI